MFMTTQSLTCANVSVSIVAWIAFTHGLVVFNCTGGVEVACVMAARVDC